MDSQQKILNSNFLYYVQENDIEKAKKSLEMGAYIDALDPEFGRPALIYAIFNENMDMFKMLLEKGANPNKLTDYRCNYFSPLMALAMKNSYEKATKTQKEMAQILINAGANINATDYHGRTALVLSVYYCQPEMAELLIKNGADVNKSEDGKATALRIAQVNWSRRQDFKKVIALLEEKSAPKEAVEPTLIAKGTIKMLHSKGMDNRLQNDGNG